jgi:hypothetical protein
VYPATQETITLGALREGAQVTGQSDEDPGIAWFARQCQSNQVRFEALISNAERTRDAEMAAFFRRAEAVGRTLAKRDTLAAGPFTHCALA